MLTAARRATAGCAIVAVLAGCTTGRDGAPAPAASPPTVRVTGTERVTPPADPFGQTIEDIAWVVEEPGFRPPPSPDGVRSCKDLHAWEHAQGAIDMGGTQVVIQLWAARAAATVRITSVTAHVLRRQEPFETQALVCASGADVPVQSELLLGEQVFFAWDDTTTPRLDNRPDGMDVGLTVPDRSFELGLGDTTSFPVRVQAFDGWYDWTIQIALSVNDVPTAVVITDGGRPFSTNSGFRGPWRRRSAYVWCVAADHPRFEVQSAPFLCPYAD